MSIIISALAFLFLLSFLVILHEFGHFFAARFFKVTVEEFGFGLPPRFATMFHWLGTRFSLNAIPFGGFVRLKGENAEDEHERYAEGSFSRASVLGRIVILCAGVFMNFLLAILIFTVGFSAGKWIPTYLTFEDMIAASDRGDIHFLPGVLVNEVASDGTAAEAGVPAKAILLKVDGTEVILPQEVAQLQKDKEQVTYTLLVGENFEEEKTITVPVRGGITGIVLSPFPRDLSAPDRSLPEAFVLALREAKIVLVQTVLGLAQLGKSLTRTLTVPEGITGPVGIAQLTFASVQEGFSTYMRLVALLSLSLAALNILPFPALDGGRLVFVLIEAIRGRPTNRTFELMTNMIGFLCLIGLILLITYYDIVRLF